SNVKPNHTPEARWAALCISLWALSPALALAQAGATDPAPAAQPPSDEAALDAQAEALVASLANDSADVVAADVEAFKLNIYGFADFTYTHTLNDFSLASPYPTFLVGNLNLYAGADLGDGWRTLTEFRL